FHAFSKILIFSAFNVIGFVTVEKSVDKYLVTDSSLCPVRRLIVSVERKIPRFVKLLRQSEGIIKIFLAAAFYFKMIPYVPVIRRNNCIKIFKYPFGLFRLHFLPYIVRAEPYGVGFLRSRPDSYFYLVKLSWLK